MTNIQRYSIIGAGHGGRAMAAHLALMGCDVALYNRTPEHIDGIKARKGIDLESGEGGPHGFARLALVTADMEKAVQHAQVLDGCSAVLGPWRHRGQDGPFPPGWTDRHFAPGPDLRGD
jgi:2-polyprenyl-6-methoxyphenol hydroxylase-like FAD-dependent oxidoreductase